MARGIAVQNFHWRHLYAKRIVSKSRVKASINVSDLDMFKLMNRVVRYIHMWESNCFTDSHQERKTASPKRTAATADTNPE